MKAGAMQLNYHSLDVFTEHRYAGNPLAVVRDAGALDSIMMQKIARELNLSETVFVLPSSKPAHSARLRIFTPAQELPFAGHPTVGAAVLLGELRMVDLGSDQDGIVILELTAGTVRVGVRVRHGHATYAEFDAPRLPVEAGILPPVETLSAALSLIPSEIGFENHRPACFAAGNAFAFIPVSTLEALARAAIDPQHWAAAFREQGLAGAYLYTRQAGPSAPVFHARMFAPDLGVPEDPATGSAAVCLAGAACHFDRLPDGTHKRIIEQGVHMGRPSFIHLTTVVVAGKLNAVRIGGHAVRVAEGTLTV
jgi:trans-2,3-dihydro-3-hydroxyanthranilate isomerase